MGHKQPGPAAEVEQVAPSGQAPHDVLPDMAVVPVPHAPAVPGIIDPGNMVVVLAYLLEVTLHEKTSWLILASRALI